MFFIYVGEETIFSMKVIVLVLVSTFCLLGQVLSPKEYFCDPIHMFVSCVHPVAVLNAVVGITFRLLMLVEDAVLFILGSKLFLYSTGSGEQVVLSGFSVRLFCFVQSKTLCRYGCM